MGRFVKLGIIFYLQRVPTAAMKDSKILFHYLSYLQYPLMLVALCFAFKPYFNGFETIWADYNRVLVFAGLGFAFSTLQDSRKTQNNFSKKVWENPKYGKALLAIIALQALLMMIVGILGLFAAKETVIKDLCFGLVVFSVGLIGVLKSAVEMFENHQKLKNTPLQARVVS